MNKIIGATLSSGPIFVNLRSEVPCEPDEGKKPHWKLDTANLTARPTGFKDKGRLQRLLHDLVRGTLPVAVVAPKPAAGYFGLRFDGSGEPPLFRTI